MDQHVAAADAEHHHEAGEQHHRGDARLDQLPHDPQPGIVHPPRLAAGDREGHGRSHGHRRRPERAGHEPSAGQPRSGSEPAREHRTAHLHHPPHRVVVHGGASLEAVGAMAGEDHARRQQAAKDRHDRAPEQPFAVGGHMEPRDFCRDQVHEEHEADRAAARKREPAGHVGLAEHGDRHEVGERHPGEPAVEVLGLHLGKVFFILRERAHEQQERGGEEHRHRDLERAGGPEQLPREARRPSCGSA